LYRTLLELGPFKIQAYGLMLSAAFLLGGIMLLRSARKKALDEGAVLNLIYIIVFTSVLGSRLMYVITHLEDYRGDPASALKVWEGGLTLYGGLILAIVSSVVYMRAVRLPVWTVCDLAAPAIALGKAVTRVGCFMNGCCFGARTDLPWGVVFPPDSHAGAVLPGARLHPAQLYSSGLSFVIFVILLRLGKGKHPPGTVFWSFMLMDSIARALLGFARYSEPGARLFALGGHVINSNQLIGALLAVLSAVVLARMRSARRG